MANSVDPDEMAHYEPSHLALHCLQKYLSFSTGLKRLSNDGVFCMQIFRVIMIISLFLAFCLSAICLSVMCFLFTFSNVFSSETTGPTYLQSHGDLFVMCCLFTFSNVFSSETTGPIYFQSHGEPP